MSVSSGPELTHTVRGCWLTVNRACNLRCEWCYAAGEGSAAGRNMPLELARQLLDAAAELGAGSAVLIGGEPTLYPYLSEVAKHARWSP